MPDILSAPTESQVEVNWVLKPVSLEISSMATRPSSIRMNGNATRAASGSCAVSHDLINRWLEKTRKTGNVIVGAFFFSEKEIRKDIWMVEEFTENGSCTRDDLHEHLSPGKLGV